MGSWLFKTPVGPQAHYLNPLQFYTIKKEKAELGSTVQKAKLVWNREIFYIKTSSINGWRYDLFSISISILFKSYSASFRIENPIYLIVGIRAIYLCLGVLYIVAAVGFSLCYLGNCFVLSILGSF